MKTATTKAKTTPRQAAKGQGHKTRDTKAREALFCRELEIALNEPTRATRAWRQNSGALLVRKNNATMRVLLAPEGSGDLVVLERGGLHIEVETKAKGGKLRPAQERRAAFLRSWGALHVAVWPASDDMRVAVRIALTTIDSAIREFHRARTGEILDRMKARREAMAPEVGQ
jgi:hypothetical protein